MGSTILRLGFATAVTRNVRDALDSDTEIWVRPHALLELDLGLNAQGLAFAAGVVLSFLALAGALLALMLLHDARRRTRRILPPYGYLRASACTGQREHARHHQRQCQRAAEGRLQRQGDQRHAQQIGRAHV